MMKYGKYLEAVQNMNSDKEVKIRDYQEKLKYYNANKDKFTAILANSTEDKWEDLANKIIRGNIYLGAKWKLDKIAFVIKRDEDKTRTNELSKDEEKKLQQDINDNKKTLSTSKQELTKKIANDLLQLQRL